MLIRWFCLDMRDLLRTIEDSLRYIAVDGSVHKISLIRQLDISRSAISLVYCKPRNLKKIYTMLCYLLWITSQTPKVGKKNLPLVSICQNKFQGSFQFALIVPTFPPIIPEVSSTRTFPSLCPVKSLSKTTSWNSNKWTFISNIKIPEMSVRM